jgi:RES domain
MVRPSAIPKAVRTVKTSRAAARSTTVPVPPAVLHVSSTNWPRGRPIHRIHLVRYAADGFNPGRKGNARFSPIVDTSGAAIPTLYGGSTFDCAAMETVFHDVPFTSGFKSFDKRKLVGQIHSVLLPATDLVLADLSNVALRKLGVPRAQLIDTEKDCYPETRKWAEAIHARAAKIQGLCWTSRQDDQALAIILFGDRIVAKTLMPHGSSRALLSDPSAYAELLILADRIGVSVVAGKS